MDTRTRTAGRPLTILAAAVVAAASAPASAQTWALYDDFTATSLSPQRWTGEEGSQFGGLRQETRRAIVNGQLRLEMRSYGDNMRDEGFSSARNTVLLARSPAVSALKATVTMRTAHIGACATNTVTTGSVRARLFGFFFNAGTPIERSMINETFAGIQVYRNHNTSDAAGLFRVSGFIGTCIDDNCVTSKTVAASDLLTGVALNQPVDLAVAWDAAANAFRFTVNGVQTAMTYTLRDSGQSTNPVKRLEVLNHTQQCAGSRVLGVSAADFDNVQTNALPN